MQKFDLHMHTVFCDGKNSVAEMVESAADLGLEVVGISGHSHTAHDEGYCMSCERTLEYLGIIEGARTSLVGESIRILKGLEMDYYSDENPDIFDYIIGSCHYVMTEEAEGESAEWAPVDESADVLLDFAEEYYGGDMLAVAERYFEIEGGIVAKTGCDIIGHFDLLTKFSEREPELIDQTSPRYVTAWKKAVDRIFADTAKRYENGDRNRLFDVGNKPVFEINTGAISRGYRTTPYPASEIIEYIRGKGGFLILDSDSHSADTIAFRFDEFAELADKLEISTTSMKSLQC